MVNYYLKEVMLRVGLLHIKDIYKLIELLDEAKEEIGRIYGDRVKDSIPIYKKLKKTIKEIRCE